MHAIIAIYISISSEQQHVYKGILLTVNVSCVLKLNNRNVSQFNYVKSSISKWHRISIGELAQRYSDLTMSARRREFESRHRRSNCRIFSCSIFFCLIMYINYLHCVYLFRNIGESLFYIHIFVSPYKRQLNEEVYSSEPWAEYIVENYSRNSRN